MNLYNPINILALKLIINVTQSEYLHRIREADVRISIHKPGT